MNDRITDRSVTADMSVQDKKAKGERKRYGIKVVQASGGTVTAANYGRCEPITEKEHGKYVELRISPCDGYFLKDLKILTGSSTKVRRYDGADSFGFDMPRSDVTLIPEFEKRDAACEVPPADRLYREVRDYRDGRYTGRSLYIPVEIKGIPESCAYGEKPKYTVRASDGTELAEGRDHTLAQASEKTDEGIRHILIFEGRGGPEKGSDGYFTEPAYVYKGKQVITYTEKYKSAYSKLPELTVGENKAVRLGKGYCFTPAVDGTYCFTFDKPDPLYLKVIITSDDKGEKPIEGTVNNGSFTALLRAGVTYSVSTRATYNTDDIKALDVTVYEYVAHRISAARSENGLLAVVSGGASVSSAYFGETADIRIAPADGYYLKSLSVTSADGENVGLIDCFYTYLFKMPNNDVLISAEFAEVALTSKTVPEDSLYRETEVYQNGRRTDGVLYVPVEITLSDDTCIFGRMPGYTVRSADGMELSEGVDYTVYHEVEEGFGGKLHTLVFEGTGAVFKGEQVITFTEMPAERLTTGSNDVRSDRGYVFIPKEDGKYQITFKGLDTMHEGTRITSDEGDIDMDASGSASFSFTLCAGREYSFSFASDCGPYMAELFEIMLEKLASFKLIITDNGYGTVVPDSFGAGVGADGTVVEGDIIALWMHPDEGYILTDITAFDEHDCPVELIDAAGGRVYHFKMPACDVRVNAVFGEEHPVEETSINDTDMSETAVGDITAEELVRETSPMVSFVNTAKDNYSVTCGKTVDMGYKNYITGNDVFKLDFEFNNLKKARYRGALLEFVFDAPIGKFLYGADIGNSIVIIAPDDPKKLIVNFSTYENDGEDAEVKSSYLVISPSQSVSGLNCTAAKVISVTE